MFRLSKGPWTQLFEGTSERQSIEIYSNPESMILVLIFEKEGDKIIGVVIELFRVFSCKGETEAFAENLTEDATIFLKHLEKKTFKFLVLGSLPTYAEFEESKIQNEFDAVLKKIDSKSQTAKNMSKAYGLVLTELQYASEEEKSGFFAEPLSLQMLSRSAIEMQKPGRETAAGITGELLLGITKFGNIAKEPLEFFKRTVITGPNEKYRLHAEHLVIEGTLLSNLPAVIIDCKNAFRGLSEPTKDLQGLRKFKVEFEPIGFPVAHFTVPETIRIDLGIIDILGMLEVFGAGRNIITRIVDQKTAAKRFANIPAIIEEIKKTVPTEDTTAYQLNKAVRILALFEQHYPKVAGGPNNFEEISKSWSKGLGRAGIIHIENADEKETLLLVHSIVRGMLAHFRKLGNTNRLRAMLILPEAQKILSAKATDKVSELVATELNELSEYGVGFAASAEKSPDLKKEIIEKIEAEIDIIEKNDAGIRVRNLKNYRVLLRPGLSSCTEV